jgi:hypothetical protein
MDFVMCDYRNVGITVHYHRGAHGVVRVRIDYCDYGFVGDLGGKLQDTFPITARFARVYENQPLRAHDKLRV